MVYPKPIDPALAPVLPDGDDLAAVANMEGVSAIGAVSIQVYGLNRLALVQARTKVLRDLEFLLEMALGLGEVLAQLEERIAHRSQEIETALAADAQRLRKDNELDEQIGEKIDGYRTRILAHMRSMTEPAAPFSAMARAWVQAYVAGG